MKSQFYWPFLLSTLPSLIFSLDVKNIVYLKKKKWFKDFVYRHKYYLEKYNDIYMFWYIMVHCYYIFSWGKSAFKMPYSSDVIRFSIDGRTNFISSFKREKTFKRGFGSIRSSLSLFKFFPMGRWKQNWRMNKRIEEFPPGIHPEKISN